MIFHHINNETYNFYERLGYCMKKEFHFEPTDFYSIIPENDDIMTTPVIQKIEDNFPEYIEARSVLANIIATRMNQIDKDDGIDYNDQYNLSLAKGIIDHSITDSLSNVQFSNLLLEREQIYKKLDITEKDVLSISIIADFCEAARRIGYEKMNADLLDEKAIESRFSMSERECELAREYRIYPNTTFQHLNGSTKAKIYNICAVPSINILSMTEEQARLEQEQLLNRERELEQERLNGLSDKLKKEIANNDYRDDAEQEAKVLENIEGGIARDEIIDEEQFAQEQKHDQERNHPEPAYRSNDELSL